MFCKAYLSASDAAQDVRTPRVQPRLASWYFEATNICLSIVYLCMEDSRHHVCCRHRLRHLEAILSQESTSLGTTMHLIAHRRVGNRPTPAEDRTLITQWIGYDLDAYRSQITPRVLQCLIIMRSSSRNTYEEQHGYPPRDNSIHAAYSTVHHAIRKRSRIIRSSTLEAPLQGTVSNVILPSHIQSVPYYNADCNVTIGRDITIPEAAQATFCMAEPYLLAPDTIQSVY